MSSKDRFESYTRLQNLLRSQENVIKTTEEYRVARKGREGSIGSLVLEQERLRDIHADMDALSSSHSSYPSLLASEVTALNNIHARLFDLQQHERSDHHQYLQFCTALQTNFEAERESEKKARRLVVVSVFIGLLGGMVLTWLVFQAVRFLHQDHSGDALLYSYATNSRLRGPQEWIDKQHHKITDLLMLVSKELDINTSNEIGMRREGVEMKKKIVGVEEEGVKNMMLRNRSVGDEIRRVTDALKRHSLPVLEVHVGGMQERGERGLWMTTIAYTSAALLVPLIACLLA